MSSKTPKRIQHPEFQVGDRFGKLRVNSKSWVAVRERWYDCICDCGTEKQVRRRNLQSGYVTCCGCDRYRRVAEKNWRGHGEISARLFGQIRENAKRRKIDFNITIEQVWQKFLHQERRCAISGTTISFRHPGNRLEKDDRGTASLDRVDSNFGYSIENVQWVHKTVNRMKMSLGQNDFLDWVCLLYDYCKAYRI